MRIGLLLPLCLLLGCASQHRAAKAPSPAPVGRVAGEGPSPRPVTYVQTQYAVAGYRDPSEATVWHEPHAILRRTEVPATAAASFAVTGPLTAYVPASYAPLPPSAELDATLAQQTEITRELRAMKTKMASLQQQAQEQYGKLVSATAETDRLRAQLASEQARLKAAETVAASPNPPGTNW